MNFDWSSGPSDELLSKVICYFHVRLTLTSATSAKYREAVNPRLNLPWDKLLDGKRYVVNYGALSVTLPSFRARVYYEAQKRGTTARTHQVPGTTTVTVQAFALPPLTADAPVIQELEPISWASPTYHEQVQASLAELKVAMGQDMVTVSYDLDDYDATCTCGQAPTCLPACFNAGQTEENRRLLAEKQLRAQGVTPPAPPSAPPGAEDLGLDPAPVADWAKERNAQLMAEAE